MRVSIVFNPRSGRGKAQRLTDAIAAGGLARGHTIERFDITRGELPTGADLGGADRVVVVGGDGTVHHLLPALMESRVPFQHCGTGTANLICKTLRMPRSAAGVLAQLEQESEPRRIDVPTCCGQPFLIMASLGLDASVIHRFEESRTRGGYQAYVLPVIREVLSPRIASLRVEMDGQDRPGLGGSGVLVVANMPGYGGGFNPCPRARWDDGVLDVARIPGRTSLGLGFRFLQLRARLGGAARAKGRSVRVAAQGAACVQVDGEKPRVGSVLSKGGSLVVEVLDGSVLAHAPGLRSP